MAAKRKLQVTGFHDGPLAKKWSQVRAPNTRANWLNGHSFKSGWRSWGYPATKCPWVPSNMVAEIQDLVDPDFEPLANTTVPEDEPRFLKPLHPQLSPEDIELLKSRGALSIPETELRNELLRCYIQWVHNFMPVLDLQEFLRCIAENDSDGNISILLFQTVMFVGTAFVDLKYLQAAGYETRKDARNALYSRLKLLFSFDCEEDRLVILQAALLITNWFEYGREDRSSQRDIWDWIGICNMHGHSIGLNRDPTKSNLDPKTKRLRLRLWWSLYTRDRLVAMGLRRPTQINEGTSDMPMLAIGDFEFEPFHPSVVAMLGCRQLVDVSHQKRLATMFIELIKLCQCIGRVLFAQYTASHHLFGMTNRTTITLVPRQASESELVRCGRKLDSWYSGLSKDAHFMPPSARNFSEGDDVLFLHSGMLEMLYHATSCALHRPWATGPFSGYSHGDHSLHSNSRQERQNTIQEKLDKATTSITHIIQGFNQMDLARFLPQTGLTVILPAAVAHLTKSTSNNPATREESIGSFQRCVQVLRKMQDVYPAADMEVNHLEAAVKVQCDSCDSFLKLMQGINVSPSNALGCSSSQDRYAGFLSTAPVDGNSQNKEDGDLGFHKRKPSIPRRDSRQSQKNERTAFQDPIDVSNPHDRIPSPAPDIRYLKPTDHSPPTDDDEAINIDRLMNPDQLLANIDTNHQTLNHNSDSISTTNSTSFDSSALLEVSMNTGLDLDLDLNFGVDLSTNMDFDWFNELQERGADFNPDGFGGDSASPEGSIHDHRYDFLSASPKELLGDCYVVYNNGNDDFGHSHGGGGGGGAPVGITGDLDRDLGLLSESGDEVF